MCLWIYRFRKNAAFKCWIKWNEVTCIDLHETDETVDNPTSKHSQTYMDAWGNTSKQKTLHSWKTKTVEKPKGMYEYRNEIVSVHPDPNLCVGMDDSTILSALTKLSLISHENLLRFVGVVLDGPIRCVLTDKPSRGSINEFLQRKDLDLTLDFKISLLLDVVSGMHYVHHSALGHHGQLTSKCCFLDAKFTCKIGRYWTNSLSVSSIHNANIAITQEDALWMAPEVLRDNSVSNKSDMYSFGIIMQEVLHMPLTNHNSRQVTSPNLFLLMVHISGPPDQDFRQNGLIWLETVGTRILN